MGQAILPRYPIYIPSKGRPNSLTANFLAAEGVPFYLVVEPQEAELYAARYGAEHILVLPFSNLGQGSIPARNWIKQHSIAQGHERHWQLDDNIREMYRYHQGKRLRCKSGIAFRCVEDFVDRYENVAIAGMNYTMFATGHDKTPAYRLNVHVYSCTLVLNSIPYSWRGRYNEDTDLCLQALSGGWCTVLVNAFLCNKIRTLTMKGGNTDELYSGDGRLHMARELERRWPGVVETKRRFGRPQHVIVNAWKNFTTPLKLKPGVDLEQLKAQGSPYDLELKVKKEIKSRNLREYVVSLDKEAQHAE